MLIYTLRRLASAIPTIFIIITLTFFMIRAGARRAVRPGAAARSR